MVAYSFKKRFADQIINHEKRQTIRKHRKRHARLGEPVQLFTGMRTKHCRKLLNPDPICRAVSNLRITVPRKLEPAAVYCRAVGLMGYVTEDFARADGFDGVEDFTQFWFDTHGPGTFEGVLIRWASCAQIEREDHHAPA